MFWRRNKSGNKLKELEERLAKNAKLTAEDHDALVALKTKHANLLKAFSGLGAKVGELQTRQNKLRRILFEATRDDENND